MDSEQPLIVDKTMKRFWVLVSDDGTMYAAQVSAEYSINVEGDYEATVFTSLKTAKRAAAHTALNYDEDVTPVEVTICKVAAKG